MKCIYVDDIFLGGDSVEVVNEIVHQIVKVFHLSGFDLRKWTSNADNVLRTIPPEFREIHFPLSLNQGETVKTLGLTWSPVEDAFSFKFNFDDDIADGRPITKRSILSTIARLFDPLGFLCPTVLCAKLILRKVWLENLGWDNEVSNELKTEWREFVRELTYLCDIRIPRWLTTLSTDVSFEIHAFCDASKNAYASAIYLRSSYDGQTFHSKLLMSKSKVAPIKMTTTPKLELLGAHLSSILLRHVRDHIRLPIKQPPVFAWTDAEIVLYWLYGDQNRWDVFVNNRVTQILEVTKFEQWRNVPTEMNPADCATRGLGPRDLKEHTLWWNGPQFLQQTIENWPPKRSFEELQGVVVRKIHLQIVGDTDADVMSIIQQFSRYGRLLRVIAWIFRFRDRSLLKQPISAKELNNSRDRLVRAVQLHAFPEEIGNLTRKQMISHKSKILKLNPFIDSNGTLRVGGRLKHSLLHFDERHPIILPSKNHFTKLLIREYHRLSLHGNSELLLSLLRKTYWIINARKTVRSVIHKCLICYRFRAQAGTQLMGNLPAPRVRPSNCFNSTGVDYAGPIKVTVSKGRGITSHKGYIVVFVCLAVKAIHLEVVGDMTTETFLAALQRFISRRGLCSHMYSDNGTTFVGATNQMKSDAVQWKASVEQEVIPYLSSRQIQWHFIPPAAPHMGGLWEAGVKSMKYHLKRICSDQSFTFEEWSTFLASIEACLNSRPLCPTTSDPEDLTALTPGHFLVGDALLALPESNLEEAKVSTSKRWARLVQMKQIFWRRWSSEYLNRLQSRPKWMKPAPNFGVSDLVLIKDERLPPQQWLMGRIVETRPGTDGLVRAVSVKTKNGTVSRPIAKICPLPMETDDPN